MKSYFLLSLPWQGWLALLVIWILGYVAFVYWAGFNDFAVLIGFTLALMGFFAMDLVEIVRDAK